jgi:Flp pilus assembly protein TadD
VNKYLEVPLLLFRHIGGICFKKNNTVDNKKAVAEFSHSLNLDRYDAITLSNRGRAYARMGDYDKAVADFEAAAKIDPSNKLIKQNLERAKKREKGL